MYLFIHIHLHLCRFTRKVLTNHPSLLETTTCPVTSPITNPQAYPITTVFQLNPSPNEDSWLGVEVGASLFTHFFNNGEPHDSKFPSKEEFGNVENCPPCGMGPITWF